MDVKEMLEEVDYKLLKVIYNMEFEKAGRPNLTDIFDNSGKETIQQAAYHLNKLNRIELLEFDGEFYHPGGRIHEIYNNNAVMIQWENIHITKDGLRIIKD